MRKRKRRIENEGVTKRIWSQQTKEHYSTRDTYAFSGRYLLVKDMITECYEDNSCNFMSQQNTRVCLVDIVIATR